MQVANVSELNLARAKEPSKVTHDRMVKYCQCPPYCETMKSWIGEGLNSSPKDQESDAKDNKWSAIAGQDRGTVSGKVMSVELLG